MSPSAVSDEKTPILLLKTKSEPSDSYEEYFQAGSDFAPSFVPVLEHKYNAENLQKIKNFFRDDFTSSDARRKYGGLIFTSQRAVEGFARAVQEVPSTALEHFDLILYVVGPATSRSLKALQASHLRKCQILGEETGNGENLAHFILDHYDSAFASDSKPPLLFLVGEQRRDIIPQTLMSQDLPDDRRLEVEEMVVYETGVMASFESQFRKELESNQAKKAVWVVVFSPTGCEVMLRNSGLLDEETGRAKRRCQSTGQRQYFVATIGPTTRDYLRKTFGFEPDVCASKPSPEGIGQGIEKFLSQMKN